MSEKREKVLDSYDILEFIGQGKFGLVYSAKDKISNEIVALKLVYRTKLKECDMRKEKNILQSLNHPNIVKYINYFEDDKRYYLIEELVDGGDLIDVLKVKKRYVEVDAKKLVLSLLQAVQYMHSNNIIHRDIKCDNILCKVDVNGNISLKITDFGHACECNQNELIFHDVGTPGYRSPELIEKKLYGKPVDMFSVGVVSYLILIGLFPFHHNHPKFHEKVRRLEHCCNSEEPRLKSLWSAISTEAQSFLLNLLEYNPVKRLTAEEALNHPWIKDLNSLDLHDLSEALTEIVKFNARRKLIASIRKVMCFNIFKKVTEQKEKINEEIDNETSVESTIGHKRKIEE
jgi:calcium/calmodulin-dependent protein kinase I